MGCRFHFGRPWRGPGVQLSGVCAVVCIFGGPGGDPGIQRLRVWAVVGISGGPCGNLGVQLSAVVCILDGAAATWGVWAVVCIFGGLGGDLTVQLSGVCVVACILGGTDGDLGGPTVMDLGNCLHFGQPLVATWVSSCSGYGLSGERWLRPGGAAVGCHLHFRWPWWRPGGPTVKVLGCRLCLGRLWRRPANPAVGYIYWLSFALWAALAAT